MPDTRDVDFDAARRALDAVPAPDLWDDAQRRAANGEVVPLTVGSEQPRHAGRWLAVAAATVLAVGAVAVVAMNDDGQPVDTGPLAGSDEITWFEDGDCTFGVTHPPGETVNLAAGGDGPPRLNDQPSTRFDVGAQEALVHVPGYSVRDLLGERVEDVQLARGTAQLWSTPEFVQVRWFPGMAQEDPCASFTVTVGLGVGADDPSPDALPVPTTAESRSAAIGLAQRIVLQSELPGGATPVDVVAGYWQLERSAVSGNPTDGPGLTFGFIDGKARWTDGCSGFRGTYAMVGATTMRVVDIVSITEADCAGNPTAEAVNGVMGAEQIEVTTGSGRDIVVLSAGTTVLTLVPVEPRTRTSTFEAVGEPILESPVDPSTSTSTFEGVGEPILESPVDPGSG